MSTRFPVVMLLVCTASVLACSEDFESGFRPNLPPEFNGLEVRPAGIALATAAPGNTAQLTVRAYDRLGEPMEDIGVPTYSSSAPEIAGVNSSGLVTAVAPGLTEISASLTVAGTTRTAFTIVTVHTRVYSDIAGVYDLVALVTNSGGWGYEGYRYTAVLTLEEEAVPRGIVGTYTDLRFIGPGDSIDVSDAGVITSSVNAYGEVMVELLGDGNRRNLTLIVGTVGPGFIDGRYGCCDNFSGTFTAERR